jgi:hypothetical protein
MRAAANDAGKTSLSMVAQMGRAPHMYLATPNMRNAAGGGSMRRL